ncbi:MAG TPA: glycosyltransferase, partial [Polyangia bacterium]
MNVGVVIPVRDGARYLGEALDSVLAQTHPAADIVVVDDGSRDRTARVAAAYAPRVRCLSVAGRGIGAARNRGVAEVGGELIAFLDGDDSWPPDRLERQLSAFADDASSPDLVFGYVEQFLSSDLDAAARAGLICPETPQPAQLANTMLVRRTVWERVGPFSTTAVRSEFLDWLLRARDLDLREVMIEDVVLRRRLHATNHGRVLHDSAGEYAVTLKRALDRRRRAVTRTRAPVVVLGAGPAGLTAGYLLARRGEPVIVLEAGRQVGGLARTEVRDGYRFDLGGHRFYTKHAEVDALWREIMGDELLTRPRQSRIYWRGRFLDYPLHGADVVRKLGAVELMLCGASYLLAATRPRGGEQNLQEWVSNRFGRRLYKHFFEAYTQKVWGVPAREIRAEWAAQRIRGLSFASAARAALGGRSGRD